jgi:hypothetical protein
LAVAASRSAIGEAIVTVTVVVGIAAVVTEDCGRSVGASTTTERADLVLSPALFPPELGALRAMRGGASLRAPSPSTAIDG